MKNKLKRIILSITIITILLNMILIPQKVNAMGENETNGITVVNTVQAPYKYMNVEVGQKKILEVNGNPVYVTDSREEISNTILNNNTKSTNEQLNQTLKNGYPYKTVEEMYCESKEEAYLATQEAILITLGKKEFNKYSHIGEPGWRIVGAIARIIRDTNSDIQNLEDTNKYNKIDIQEESKEWILDSQNENYKTKIYNVTVLPKIIESLIKIEGGENVKVLDESNQPKNTFTNTDKIKISIPKDSMQNASIKLSAKLQNYETYISCNTQDLDTTYIIVEKTYTNVEKQIKIKNEEISTIKIINLDNETKVAIQGNTFELLDKNYGVIKNDIITDENGEYIIPNIPKDKYYLRQTSVIDGYSKNGMLIEIDITGKEELVKININNCKTNITEEDTYNKEINVTQKDELHIQNNVKHVSNITTTNITDEIRNTINETNLNNINYFTNTKTMKNETYLKKINHYTSNLDEKVIINTMLDSDNMYLGMTRNDFNNYMDIIKVGQNNIPKLPIASK